MSVFVAKKSQGNTQSNSMYPMAIRIVLGILIVLVVVGVRIVRPLSYSFSVDVQKGGSVQTIWNELSSFDALKMKIYTRVWSISLDNIEQGTYTFSGSYSPSGFVRVVEEGPVSDFASLTILEGRGIYDTDLMLSTKGYIQPGEYISYVTNVDRIMSFVSSYPFLNPEVLGISDTIVSLEGFLYPDTYFVDVEQDVVSQLVRLQLNTFVTRVRQPLLSNTDDFSQRLSRYGYDFGGLSLYEILILSTIVEKEERVQNNRPRIASLFLNRLQYGERIDADISLCYGLQQPYETCTPAVIVRNLYDAQNPYNTRAVSGLPPTPIASPTVDAVKAVVAFAYTDSMFYLHDPSGRIHFADTISEHNKNKRQYLNSGN